jgi:hypothetical protein
MDRKFGEYGFAFMLCGQELRPGEYTNTNVVHAGAKFRCALNALGENGNVWTAPLQDGETASIVGLLADGGVAGQVYVKTVEPVGLSFGEEVSRRCFFLGFHLNSTVP